MNERISPMPRSPLTLALFLALALLAGCGTPDASEPTARPTNEVDAALSAMATNAPVPTRSHTRPTAVTPATPTTTALTSSTNIETVTAATSAPTVTGATASPAATATRTAVPAASAAPAAPEQIGTREGTPINPDDGKYIPAIPEKWFVVERFNNLSNPPIHEFVAIQGKDLGNPDKLAALGIPTGEFKPGNAYVAEVRADTKGLAPYGERAWLATNKTTALHFAQLSANGKKAENQGYKIIGPDGIEVR